MADRIAVMRAGGLAQVAPPREIYEHPASRWVAEFIGDVNLFEGTILAVDANETLVETAAMGKLRLGPGHAAHRGDRVTIAIRPERIVIARAGEAAAAPNATGGILVDTAYLGGVSIYKVRLDRGGIVQVANANVGRGSNAVGRPGGRVTLSFGTDAGVVLTQ